MPRRHLDSGFPGLTEAAIVLSLATHEDLVSTAQVCGPDQRAIANEQLRVVLFELHARADALRSASHAAGETDRALEVAALVTGLDVLVAQFPIINP